MIAPQPFYSDRGTPMNVRLLATVLGEAGHSVDLLVFPTGRDITLTNVRIIRLPNILAVRQIPVGPSKIKLLMDVLMIIFLFWLCLSKKYDVIHGVEEGGFMAVAFSRVFRKACVLDLDSWISDQLRYSDFIRSPFFLNCISRIERWAINNSSVVLTVCSALTEKVRGILPLANIVQIEDIPLPGLDEYDDQTVETLKDRYDLRHNYKIVYTGNLEKYQGIDFLLDAWQAFISNETGGKAYKLVIVGGSVEKVEHYKKIAGEKKLADSICWAGQRPVNEMGAWMALSDILVSPRSDGENTPLKIFSYMAAGRPIVATRRKTHTQVLDDSSAFLAEPAPEKFAEALMTAVNGGEEAVEKGSSARKTVEATYSYDAFSKKLLDAYNSINQTL
jgi:glycosyltransferase involved in cell wall biosynthesis